MRPRIQLISEPITQHHPIVDRTTIAPKTQDQVMTSEERVDIIGTRIPPPSAQDRNALSTGPDQGASFSNLVNLDDDMLELSNRNFHNGQGLSHLEETIIALDEDWMKATKEYNALYTDKFPDAIIARIAQEQSPEQNSKEIFWSTFTTVDPITIANESVWMAWESLNSRRLMRRGLSSGDVETLVPTLLDHSDFSMWTIFQVESFFHDKSHPDWTTWDRLDMFLEVFAIELDEGNIRGRLVDLQMDNAIPLESIAPMIERF